MIMPAHEVIRVVDLEPLPGAEGWDLIQIRVEILKAISDLSGEKVAPGLFSAKVYRLETYTLKPTFSPNSSQMAEERIWVFDEFINSRLKESFAKNQEEMLEHVIRLINTLFEG